jgi:hypothetical protein
MPSPTQGRRFVIIELILDKKETSGTASIHDEEVVGEISGSSV